MSQNHPPIPIHAFDGLAREYDDLEISSHLITRELRPIILQSLVGGLHKGNQILELNCGTGTDAIALGKMGFRVVATDISGRMLEIATKKVNEENLDHVLSTMRLDFDELSPSVFHNVQFDGVFSNFGGLNCSRDINAVFENVAGCLRPGGIFVACLISKYCLWESAAFLLRGKGQLAIRRSCHGPRDVMVGDSLVPISYFTPGDVVSRLRPWFNILDIYGISIFSPTLNSTDFASHYPIMTRNLLNLDSVVRRFPLFRSIGDHFVISASRR